MDITILKHQHDQDGTFLVSLTTVFNGERYDHPQPGAMTSMGIFTEETWKEVEAERVAEFKEFVMSQQDN